MPAGAIQQLSVATRQRPAIPGMLAMVALLSNEVDVLINKDPAAAEVWTVVIATNTNSVQYGLNLLSPVSASVVYTADSTATKIEIAAGLALAWNSNPLCRGVGKAVSDGVDTITITGVYAGAGGAFEIEEDESASLMTTTNTTDAAAASTVPFGRAMISTGFQSNENDELGVLAASTKFTAQVESIAVVYAASEVYYIDIFIEGEIYKVSTVGATDSATTGAALVTAINNIMPAVSVLASGTSTITLTAELAGKAFVVGTGTASGTATRLALTHTTSTPITDFNKSFKGISIVCYDEAQLSLTSEAAEYAANAGVQVCQRGAIWVSNTETIVANAPVYVELAAGANAGKLYAATSATRVRVDPKLLSWRRTDHAASGAWSASDADVALLNVRLAA